MQPPSPIHTTGYYSQRLTHSRRHLQLRASHFKPQATCIRFLSQKHVSQAPPTCNTSLVEHLSGPTPPQVSHQHDCCPPDVPGTLAALLTCMRNTTNHGRPYLPFSVGLTRIRPFISPTQPLTTGPVKLLYHHPLLSRWVYYGVSLALPIADYLPLLIEKSRPWLGDTARSLAGLPLLTSEICQTVI